MTFQPVQYADAIPLELAFMGPKRFVSAEDRFCNVCWGAYAEHRKLMVYGATLPMEQLRKYSFTDFLNFIFQLKFG